MIPDTITAVANAVGDVSKLVTKALPSEEQQLAKFKMRSPIIYGNIMERIFQKLKRYLRWHKRIEIDVWVDFKHATLADSTRTELKTLLHRELLR